MLLVSACGCSKTQSADQALNAALANSGLQREKTYPLAGIVMVDSQAPHFAKRGQKLVVMLNDPKKPDVPVMEKAYVEANDKGEFSFSTYAPGDGVKPGKYILTFAALQKKGRFGLLGPDLLNNHYNDPDKNADNKEFSIDHQAPGKTDYIFNLEIAGKETLTPGPHALTDIVDDAFADRVKRRRK